MDRLKISVRDTGKCNIVRFTGDIDGYEVKKELEKLTEKIGYQRDYIVDILKVNFLNSVGITFFQLLSANLVRNGKRLIIVMNKQSKPFKLFKLTGLSNVFSFAFSEDEAWEKLHA